MPTPKPTLSKEAICQMSEADWQARLSPEVYHVLRQKGTEPPFTGIHTDSDADGIYRCQGCHAVLFDSMHKFHSGCGWPSFDRAKTPTALSRSLDLSHGMRRIEVTCSNCGGHLGHVFDDNHITDTGLRYCINSIALDFQAR
ncbi:peptide-methionine (R)-S-oxide reductase MsrB [Moraxella sp. Tifton1]|uniref:peptide-methionine (R)-S-oxide reductase MsrB n=1 Tax=Moraxella oculi TaxID=2940516 RepID=UPI002012853D|nr:peptide-methionine (R)-S-oxide reductase MsrB [Moraxella sp. Tifton1]MCL1622641.1 peptide-methionine (R)-S-oxide reductase MsrB [Moraxella sp. Tifton1]